MADELRRAWELLRGVPGAPARTVVRNRDEWDGTELRRDHAGKLKRWQTVMCAGDVWPTAGAPFTVTAELVADLYRQIKESHKTRMVVDYDFQSFTSKPDKMAGYTRTWSVAGRGRRLVVAVQWLPGAHDGSAGTRLSAGLTDVFGHPALFAVSLVSAAVDTGMPTVSGP